jgi:NADH-quinone oxidoreductase subunit G
MVTRVQIMPDIILPSAAYTEKDSMYVNTEGRLQYAFKASFPSGKCKRRLEDN